MIVEPEWLTLIYAILLLLLGVALMIMEFFIVSFGLLSIAALASAGVSIHFAFQLGPAVGYGFVIIAVLLGVFIVRWGIRRIGQSSAVPQTAIEGSAGYRQVAERLGVAVGSQGVLVTPARPTGRARFAGGECDVQTRSQSLDRNTQIVVEQIDGPTVFVRGQV